MNSLLKLHISVDYASKPEAIREVKLEIAEAEVLGLIGESGSGKSTIALSIMRLLEHKGAKARGEILFKERDLLQLRANEMRSIRGREIALVLQSPLASLNPALKIGTQMKEAWRAHNTELKKWRDEALEAFRLVSLGDGERILDRYPQQISVGQAQRVLIAMAILHRPPLLIADEPTSALDAITQSEILRLFQSLSRELNMAILFISHDLLSVACLCDRLAILQNGSLVECGTRDEVFSNPRHPYTRALLNAIPRLPIAQSPGLGALSDHLRPQREMEYAEAPVPEAALLK